MAGRRPAAQETSPGLGRSLTQQLPGWHSQGPQSEMAPGKGVFLGDLHFNYEKCVQ